jgi:energy-coupling factor transporter ATP-binding protein EcfA2
MGAGCCQESKSYDDLDMTERAGTSPVLDLLLADPVRRSRELDRALSSDHLLRVARTSKFVLLGLPGSGKTTVLQTMRRTLGEQSLPHEAELVRSYGLCVVATNLQELLRAFQASGRSLESEEAQEAATLVAQSPVLKLQLASEAELFDQSDLTLFGRWATTLWSDPALSAFRDGGEFEPLPPTANHFCDAIGRLCSNFYSPSLQDIALARPQRGVAEGVFYSHEQWLSIFECTHSLASRKKWSHYFSDAIGLVWLVNLGDYNVPSKDDPTLTSLQESLWYLGQFLAQPSLARSNVILLLNKQDLFL